MCIVYDNRIGIRNIDTVLYDCGRKQYVVIIVNESHDYTLQFIGRHLPMSDGNTAIRHVFMNKISYFGQTADAIVHKEYLPVTAHLEVDGIGNNLVTIGRQFGMDRITIGRRRTHNAHIACPHKRKLQRARDRGGRHGERIYIALQLTKSFFRGYTELLFLVDDK